jgi:hypothetical protein
MNIELVEIKMRKIMEISSSNERSVPNGFRMLQILELNLRKRRFAEYMNIYKECNQGYS